ncbi:MAG: YebC/PmpR family DNA-binding transcriptional regulator [Magnetococcales bacterium]|nr:YebC/PmpR family DNA-binding transcriptional regulator [Magnetococcales bacterium]NGZ26712.1 YebC/PmpR family DNA-binding transcriptional regulator [Magnetococcales bacterium]
MAGHSKWANIKHRKGAQDAKRGKIFTKLIREITVSVKHGSPDPGANPRLRAAITAARAQNMPKDTIEKAIKRGSGELDGANYEEIRYEGYGPGGVAVIVDTLTDNRQRTVADVRHLLNKNGGNLGTNGCVAFMFDRKGQLIYEGVSEDALMEAALEAGAEDIIADGDNCEVLTDPDEFLTVQEALAAKGFNPIEAGVVMRPQNTVGLNDERQAELMLKLMDALEDNDDVQHVYANFDIADEIMERLG